MAEMIADIIRLSALYVLARVLVEIAFPSWKIVVKYLFWTGLALTIIGSVAPVITRMTDDLHNVANTYTAVKQGVGVVSEGVDAVTSLPDTLENLPIIGVGSSKHPPGITLWEKINPSSIRFAYPVKGTITQEFKGADHHGIDIAVAEGSEIVASREGKVSSAGFNETYGNYVILDHGGGWSTLYAHLSKVAVKKGDSLWGNKLVVGHSGDTGKSTGAHLHFEIRVGNATRDPLPLMKK